MRPANAMVTAARGWSAFRRVGCRLLAGVGVVVLAACRAPIAGDPGGVPAGSVAADVPAIVPRGNVSGRVVSVRESLRFAVVDFGLNAVPPAGTAMDVERDGVLVGRLKVGRDSRGGIVIADIQDGTARAGDRVRLP